MRSTARIALQVFGALFGVLAVLFALGAWRLSSGPLSLGFLSPYIQEAFEGEDLPYRFEFEDTVLVWAGWGEALEFHLTDLRIADTNGHTLAAVPAASLGLSGTSLLRGSIAPTSIELIEPRLGLVRRPDGSVHLATSGEGVSTDDAASDALVADLLDPPRDDHPLSQLKRVSLRDAALVLHDEVAELDWTAPNAGLTLNLDEDAVLGHLSMELQVQDLETHLEVELFHHRESKMGSAAIGFAGLNLAELAFIVPELEDFAGLRVPLSGTLAFDIAPGGILGGVVFDVAGGEGEIALAEMLPAPVPVRRLAAAGSVDGDLSRLALRALEIDTDRPQFRLDGELWRTDAGVGIEGRFQAMDMPLDQLGKYWPETFIENGREWIVQNVTDGVIAHFDTALDIEPGDFEADRFSASSAVGSLEFKDASIHYLRPIPPVAGVDGTVRFTGDSLDIAMSGGRIAGTDARRGTALVSGIHSPMPRMAVMVEAEGPLTDALTLMDHPRLELVSSLDLDLALTGGSVHSLFALEFPLLKEVEAEQIDVSAVARVRDAVVEEVAGVLDIAEGDLRLGADTASMDVRGTVTLEGEPATIAWQQHFSDNAPFARQIDVSTTMTPEGQSALGLDLATYVEGSFVVDAMYTDPGAGETPHAAFALDVSEARLEIPELYWDKPAGSPGSVRVFANIPWEGAVELTEVEIETETLYGLGRVTLARELGGVRDITITRLRHGVTDISGRVETADNSTNISIQGANLDARPYLNELTTEGAPEFGEYVLDIDVERLLTTDDQQLTEFRARFEAGAESGHVGFMEGTLATGAPVRVTLQPREGERLLTVRSRDAGAVARTFGIYDNAVGGELSMEAVVHDDRPGKPITGTVRIEDYRVTNAPTLAKLLSIATLTGILDELQGEEGIAFSQFEMPFSIEENVLTIRDGQTSGFALGVNVGGTVDLETDQVALDGTLVPAYTLNTIFDAIPILGDLLTGGEGEGLFAASFRVGGTTEEPDISVNPLSILAPGFVRDLFPFLKGNE